MKSVLLVFLILVASGCKDKPIIPVDFCPTCTSLIEVNDISWPSKPHYAWVEPIDSLFNLEVDESNPTHDSFSDALLFVNIPFAVGEYKLDSASHSEWGTSVRLHIFEFEYGTATQFYLPIYDGSSVINIESVNKSTGEFSISFNFKLFPDGDPNGEIHNSTYPSNVQFIGWAQGVVTYE